MRIPEESEMYTYRDWLEWEGRWELIDGKAYDMPPSPSSDHQFVVGELFFALRSFFGGRGCDVFVAPFDVFLSENGNDENPAHIVQPDISVICNKHQIRKQGCFGAPALVVEVLSPSTAVKDYNEKFHLYQKYGVQEYWIVDPVHKILHVHGMNEGHFRQRKTYGQKDVVTSYLFDELTIDLQPVFPKGE